MNKGSFIYWLLIFFYFVYNSSAQIDDRSSVEVRKTLAAYDRAWNAKDVKSAGDHLDDKYVYFSSVGTLSDKKSTLEFLGRPDYKLTFVERSEIVVHRADGNLSIVSSRWKGKGSWSEGEINDDQRCGQVFLRTAGKWRMVSEHCVQITGR